MSQRLRLLTVLVAMDGAINATAAAGNANLAFGSRELADDEFWRPNEDPGFAGVTVGSGADDWPVSLAASSYISLKEEHVSVFVPNFGGESGDFTTAIAEFAFGVQKVWEVDRTRPYIGGGLASVGVDVELSARGESVDDDQEFGLYLEAGVFWRLGSRFNLGLHARGMFGIDIALDFGGPLTAEGDADYLQAGLILGWGWPPE